MDGMKRSILLVIFVAATALLLLVLAAEVTEPASTLSCIVFCLAHVFSCMQSAGNNLFQPASIQPSPPIRNTKKKATEQVCSVARKFADFNFSLK